MAKSPTLPRGFNNPVRLAKDLHELPEKHWQKRGSKMALELFKAMSRHVPAYKDFLQKQKVDAKKIKSISDFQAVPPVDKDNYLRQYPREMLCWKGEFKPNRWVISTTSGSTGNPYYFPRQDLQDLQYALAAELYLRTNFEIHKKSTLYIVAFPMGAWIGGVFTYEALKILAERGNYALSIITPGIHKAEIISAVKELAGNFDQVIIGSYAPFLKDILDDGVKAGIDWKKLNLGFVFSAEAFSEQFRDYVIKKTGLKNEFISTLNHYGTVDLGTMSHETPLTNLIRRRIVNDEQAYEALLPNLNKLPTLTQYIPELFYFEDIEGNLLCSAYSGLPLARYDLKDRGGVVSLSDAAKRLKAAGMDIYREAKNVKIDKTIWNLPLVYVYERSDLSVSFYAFQIYPETIRRALHDESIEDDITGKFTMQVKYDDSAQQVFEINIELKTDRQESAKLHDHLTSLIVKSLLKESSEYRETHERYGEKIYPQLVFWPYEDTSFFRPGVKQKWVKKD